MKLGDSYKSERQYMKIECIWRTISDLREKMVKNNACSDEKFTL